MMILCMLTGGLSTNEKLDSSLFAPREQVIGLGVVDQRYLKVIDLLQRRWFVRLEVNMMPVLIYYYSGDC